MGVPPTSNIFTKLDIINSKISSIYLILTYECKDFSNQMWEKQKTPLLRGLMFYFFKNLFQQHHFPGLYKLTSTNLVEDTPALTGLPCMFVAFHWTDL